MSRKLKFSIAAAFLGLSIFAMSEIAPVQAAFPASGSPFPACGGDATAQYCIQELAYTPINGVQRQINPSIFSGGALDPSGNREVNVVASLRRGFSGDSSSQMEEGVSASLSLNFYDPLGTTATGSTFTGLRDGLYKVVIRTGEFDPSSMMLIGDYDSYSVTQGRDGFFTIALTVRPIPWASVVQMNGDDSMFNACQASKWTTNCEANMAYKKYILATFNMMENAAMRTAARGSWVSTNASMVQTSESRTALEYNFTAQGPHYVPSGFDVTGLQQENGKYLNPAFFKMYVPYSMMAAAMSQVGGAVSAADVAAMMANPSNVLTGTIWEKNGTASPVEVPQTLTFNTSNPAGISVDFNLKHFSAPNPSLKMKAPAPKKTLAISKTSSFATLATLAKLTNTKTSKISAVVATSSKNICQVVKTSVKGLKAGSCKVTVTVTTAKGKKTSQTITLKVS